MKNRFLLVVSLMLAVMVGCTSTSTTGPIHIEYRDMRIISSGDVGFIHTLERFTGKLKNGQPSDLWLRATSGVQKINGK
jgi:ketosteroid isomerase-like protein